MSSGIMYVPRPAGAPQPHRTSDSGVMDWTLFLFMAFWPRLFLLGFWIFGSELGRAFNHAIVPILGFFLFPTTTFAYAVMWGNGSNKVYGWEWIVVGIGVLVDVGTVALGRRAVRS